jgi:hypothetical protein
MKAYKPQAFHSSEFTPQALFHTRRKFMQMTCGDLAAGIIGG